MKNALIAVMTAAAAVYAIERSINIYDAIKFRVDNSRREKIDSSIRERCNNCFSRQYYEQTSKPWNTMPNQNLQPTWTYFGGNNVQNNPDSTSQTEYDDDEESVEEEE